MQNTKHEQLFSDAMKAVQDLHDYTGVTIHQTLESLEEILDEVDSLIELCRGDIKRNVK